MTRSLVSITTAAYSGFRGDIECIHCIVSSTPSVDSSGDVPLTWTLRLVDSTAILGCFEVLHVGELPASERHPQAGIQRVGCMGCSLSRQYAE